LFFKIAHNPLYMIPVGVAMFVIYASLGIFFIKKFNLATIGRESQEELDARNQAATISSAEDSEAVKFITALGGADNLLNVDACTTRLRLVVRSPDLANRAMLKVLGAKGFVVPSADSLQVILGPQAEIIAGQIRETLTRLPRDSHAISSSTIPSANINPVVDNSTQTVPSSVDIGAIVSALGNKENIKSVVIVALTRVKIEINKPELVNVEQLKDAGILSVIDVDQNTKQLYVGNSAKNLVDEVSKIINC
ncbi:MAG: PTS N-acetyl-D-glucosamine transporter, partial [Proteobacteria bacterium]